MLEVVIAKISSSTLVQDLVGRIADGHSVTVQGAVGSSVSVISSLLAAQQLARRRHTIIVVPDTSTFSVVWDDITSLTKAGTAEASVESRPVVCFPEEEVLPFDDREISASLLALRQECIERLVSAEPAIVLTTIRSLLKRIPAPASLKSYEVRLKSGVSIGFDYLGELLPDMGFEREDVVSQVGQYAVRGGIVDLYPYSSENPVRIEFDGDVVASLRSFDVMNQRSIASLDDLVIYPRTERPHGDVSDSEGSLLDYLGEGTLAIEVEPALLEAALADFRNVIVEAHQNMTHRRGMALKQPNEVYLTDEEMRERLLRFQRVHFSRLARPDYPSVVDVRNGALPSLGGHLKLLREMLSRREQRMQSFILCSNAGQVERLDELLDSEEVVSGVDYSIGVGDLHEGFEWPDPPIRVLTDHQIFGRPKRPRVHKRFKSAQALRHLQSFKPGDYVVHVDHGIAQYAGLEKVASGEHTEECLKLVYQDGDKLFVPLEHFARVQKFSAEEGVSPKLNKLGTVEWARVKSRTKKSIKDIAQDLIKLYARRKSQQGHPFSPDSHLQYQMEASFEFEDTPDQSTVTAEIKKDMESPTPMDRLVCGDVGFGKTEVAIRAVFKCVLDGKQAAVLVPTTILADQHFETFTERLREFAVRVDVLSRFRTNREQKAVLEKTKAGDIDVLIGTHRLLSRDVEFKDLGLLVIDEEQRFGVTHKEKLRHLKATVDTLTLTATPIPRTLNFSLMGGRDLSVINTPPQNRLPIKTEITTFDESLIRHALTQELDRAGQVYVVHNRVQTIERLADTVRQIVPKARYAIVHGQMSPSKLENVLHDFMKRKYDVLVATAIIENGIDIPNVNTILVDNAHHFGMAQLYQLRGRVGRSNKQAYCYLMTPPFHMLPKDSLRKLQAIEEFTELGSGFLVAMRDLEIRGAGNILGAEQSGYINAVGFDLYMQILEEAVAEVRQEHVAAAPKVPPKKIVQAQPVDVHVDVYCDTYIPDHYVNVSAERVRIYKECADARDLSALREIEHELLDRFGPPPAEVHNLLQALEIKMRACQIGFDRVTVDEQKFTLRFDRNLVKDSAHVDTVKKKLDRVLSLSSNIRLAPVAGSVEMMVGFPWYDIVKNRALEAPVEQEADVLRRVSEFLREIEINHHREESKHEYSATGECHR